MPDPKRTRIAILGGGVAALTAAFELTNVPDWQDRFDRITVYQLGWRLGGKGASGRGPYGRIEEHGLHIWLGFYENAFRVIQSTYRELGRPPGTPLASWDQAFKPHSYVVLEEQSGGRWMPWPVDFPLNDSVPGTGGELPTLWNYIEMGLGWMKEALTRSAYRTHESGPHGLGALLSNLGIEIEAAGLGLGALVLTALTSLVARLPDDPAEHSDAHHQGMVRLLDEFAAWLRRAIAQDLERDDDARRLFIMLDLGAAGARGLLADGVLRDARGLDALDGEDLLAWFKRHGASDLATESAALRALYDLGFAYRDGEAARPAFSAAVAIRTILRMCFTYKGAVFWKMQAGMGDTIFAPLYEVLKRRGVEFKFFHRVKSLGLSADRASVARITIGRQVTLKSGAYDPLVDVEGLPCWPSEPRFDQIVEGDRLRAQEIDLESFWTPWQDVEEITLEAGKDFDVVVLGISLGSLPYLCRELIEASPAWKAMVEGVETIRTMAFQLWTRRDLAGLGWPLASPVMDAFVDPLNTWADMSHLIDREAWPAGSRPSNIAYFCGPMPGGIPAPGDLDAPRREAETARTIALDWMRQSIGSLWPDAVADGGAFDWDLLVDPDRQPGALRAVAQFYRANIDPSERYVLSVPGSTRYRLPPGASGFANLYLAGDWTDNRLNAGCVEAAVMSGMQASRAICGYPKLEDIIGASHP